MGYALWASVAEIDAYNKCRIGLLPKTAGALLAFDLCINLWLTLLFVWELMTVIKVRAQVQTPASLSSFTRHVIGVTNFKNASTPTSRPESPQVQDLEAELVSSHSPIRVVDTLDKLITKSLLCLLLIVIPTSTNLIMFIVMDGMETGFACFLTCTLDSKSSCPLARHDFANTLASYRDMHRLPLAYNDAARDSFRFDN